MRDTDLPVFYSHSNDPEGVRMAAFTGEDPSDRARPRSEVTYWIGREYWGRGAATAALRELLSVVPERPLRARAAADNGGSIRVLETCGFVVAGIQRGFANARGEEIDELVLTLVD